MNEIIIAMTTKEAQEWELSIDKSVNSLRSLLADGYKRQVWKVLGYPTWTDCLKSLSDKYGFSERHAWRLHNANQTQKLLTNWSVEIPENQLRPLTPFEPEQQREIWGIAIERSNGKPTGAIVQEVVNEIITAPTNGNKPHVSNNSGENEWYTPSEYVAAARAVMGRIDIDPASSDRANETVKATRYYTKEDDGLAQMWAGKVWMNPPYSRDLIDRFTAKYAEYVMGGYVSEGIVLVNNATETGWFETLINVSDAIVFTKGRIIFLNLDGQPENKPLQGQALIYSGKNPDGFLSEFLQFGWGARL